MSAPELTTKGEFDTITATEVVTRDHVFGWCSAILPNR
jgi:hypothetical protein